MLTAVIVLVLILGLSWGGWGAGRYWASSGPYGAWGPVLILLVIIVLLHVVGVL